MIKGPKNAIPTLKGWVSPKGELLKVQKITQAQIDEWNGVTAPEPEVIPPVVEETIELEIEEVEVEAVEEIVKPKAKRQWGFSKK